MKTVHEYLNECRDMAWNNRLCYSKTYGMDAPRDGDEEAFTECVRDCEIVDFIIGLVKNIDREIIPDNFKQCQPPLLAYASRCEDIKVAQKIMRSV